MRWFSRLSLSVKLSLLVAACLAAFATFAFVSRSTLRELKVGGPVYDRVVQGKDIIADVLPPPQYIVESYLVVNLMLDEPSATGQASLAQQLDALAKDFDDRHEVWLAQLPAGRMRDLMTIEADRPARAFFAAARTEFMPALQRGDHAGAEALLRSRLAPLYDQQRAAVDKIVALATDEHTLAEQAAVDTDASATTMLLVFGVLVALVVVLMGVAATRIAAGLTRRITAAMTTATLVAQGDLTAKVEAHGTDESAKLLEAVGSMTGSLHSLVSRVKQASIELMSTASQLSATSVQQEAAVQSFGTSTTEIAAAMKEIDATSQELSSTVEGVARVAENTADLARAGQARLDEMDRTMSQLGRATSSISSKLAVIREKAADIGTVVTTISKVADQTNLLSVNAAIEAEKAGEYGLGFQVLAREIRRLADQTAVATLDIDHMVKEMQTAVSSGVMEMDKFTEEVRMGVTTVSSVGARLTEVVAQVQVLSDRFTVVDAGVRNQAAGARQINDAMLHLQDAARQTSSALREFNSASEHVRTAVSGLRDEIAHFKVN